MIHLDDDCRQNPEEREIVDEKCYCGHLKSYHRPHIRPSGHVERQIGPCRLCSCKQFVFLDWVFSGGSEG